MPSFLKDMDLRIVEQLVIRILHFEIPVDPLFVQLAEGMAEAGFVVQDLNTLHGLIQIGPDLFNQGFGRPDAFGFRKARPLVLDPDMAGKP